LVSLYSTANGVFVLISINTLKRIDNMLINVTMIVRLTVVVVKKQFVLNIFECVFIVIFIDHETHRHRVIFSCLACLIFYIIENMAAFSKKLKHRMCFLHFFFSNFTWNISYFKKNWRDIMIIASKPSIHYRICLSDLKGVRFFPSEISEKFKN